MKYITIFALVCFLIPISFLGCHSATDINDFNEESMMNYYSIEDFQSITVGKSTFQDVNKIVTAKSIQVTSYGGVCEYPKRNGGFIRIKYYGKELIVGAIEEIG